MTSSKLPQSLNKRGDSNEDFLKYFNHWYVFLITTIIFLGAAYLYTTYATPYYKVTSTLLIQNDFKGDGLLKSTAFSDLDMFHSARTVDNEMEVLRSRDLIFKTLKKLSLETKYSIQKGLGEKELYKSTLPVEVQILSLDNLAYIQKLNVEFVNKDVFILENNGKSVKYNFGSVINGPGYSIKILKGPAYKSSFSTVKVSFTDLYKLAEYYSQTGLTVLPIVKDANTVVISLLDEVPQRGMDILNSLISTYNEDNIKSQNIVAINTIKFIDNRLDNLSNELSSLERNIENYKQKNRITTVGADADINLKTSGSYDQGLSSSQIQIDLINSLANYIDQDKGEYDIVPSTLGINDMTLNNLINKYNDMQIERERLLRNNKPSNPLIININDQLASLKLNLKENIRNVKRGLLVQRNNLKLKSNEFESNVRNTPVVEKGLLERTRDQSVKAEIYQYLLQKREETALSLSSTIPTSHVVDEPAYNTNPAKPKTALIYIISLFAGVLIPGAFFYSKDKMNTKVVDSSDVQLIGTTKILGELSHKEEKNTVVVKKGSRTTISELFRYIRSNLGFINQGFSNQVMLVTSGMKGEGKTFFATNLATTLAMIEKKVVIVEFDLRKPDLLKGINLNYEKGVTDFLASDHLKVDQLIKPSGVSDNLFVLGCGKLPDDPSELLMSRRIKELFEELRQKFDYVIVDTSPVGLVADAFSLAPFVDTSIYLIRYNYTEKMQLGVLDDICENNKLKNLMIVFNDAKKTNMMSYGYANSAYGYTAIS